MLRDERVTVGEGATVCIRWIEGLKRIWEEGQEVELELVWLEAVEKEEGGTSMSIVVGVVCAEMTRMQAWTLSLWLKEAGSSKSGKAPSLSMTTRKTLNFGWKKKHRGINNGNVLVTRVHVSTT